MDYRIFSPNEKLSKYIRCYWSLDNLDDSEPHSRERIFPDGCIELIFNHGDLFVTYTKNGAEEQPKNFIHGQLKKFIEVQGMGKVGIFSIRFQPAGLQPFIDFPVSDLTGIFMEISNIWKDSSSLEEKMNRCQNNKERVEVIEAFLESRLKNVPDNAVIERCVDEIIQSDGMIAIEKLTAELKIGQRHLERKFLSNVGLSLKLFSRIIRFNNALQLIENKDFRSFTTVAHDVGFYDQAHFIKDFKYFTGLNPKKYFSENLEMAKYFNLE
ncbi:AraC family transcriptional regulator [Flavobacterium microcysteis]|uniref:Helix-turn-helix transcriptional regulator n=1 Tax=Flavobacterium microcysteis TaxID=2596891 RepID=A0A501Q4G1_9FLAO|nr:helix-turn-helix domain-containing protein [Flavobacterium microcysteis]TPD66916.1 helix-turn-helix transcriptional regulator [Flavobacterium microcysteis]